MVEGIDVDAAVKSDVFSEYDADADSDTVFDLYSVVYADLGGTGELCVGEVEGVGMVVS